MEINDLNTEFWSQRYREKSTGWDIGYPSTPITTYFDGVKDKSVSILIPGCGRAWEGEYLFRHGFKNVYLLDTSDLPKQEFLHRVSDFPANQFFVGDFFNHSERQYDFIVEQTFFCALHPSLRAQYARQTNALLNQNGHLVGLLFNDRHFSDHPPFGGLQEDYIPIFESYFCFQHFEPAYNSIKPRAGRELFIDFKKR